MDRRTFFKRAAAVLAAFAALAALPRKYTTEEQVLLNGWSDRKLYSFPDLKLTGEVSISFGDGEWHQFRSVDNKLVRI